jgi:hypothetical protein
MKTHNHVRRASLICLMAFGIFRSAGQSPIIAAGDPVLAIDEDTASNSSYPGGESPNLAIDGSTATKYLNFGRENSGIIITPASGPSVLRSFAITTANDAPERDPASVIIYGTNETIVSTDNSAGAGESWTRLAELPLALSINRFTAMAPVDVTNSESFTSYKFVFPTMKGPGHNSMQIAELQAWDEANGQGQAIFGLADSALAIHESTPESSFPLAEGPEYLFDGLTSTKYLNFGRENSGFIVTPSVGPSVAGSFILSTANDFDGRDPIGWKLFGTNAEIVTESNGTGQDEPWTLIAEGQLEPPIERFAAAPQVFFENAASYTSYKFLVTEVRAPFGDSVDSTQYSEFQLFGAEAAGAIVISAISLDPPSNEATITWDAPSGGLYRLESSGDLLDWSNLIASGLQVENDGVFSFQPPVGGKVFYRIVADSGN